MKSETELIVMLTYNDCTHENAYAIFEQCKDSKAKYFGFKEIGLPLNDMKRLYSYMKECGKTTVLEVVAYTEEECVKGAEIAVECGCSILMGTSFFDSVNSICRENNIKYMPFVGTVEDRPSVLKGDIDDIIAQAESYIKKGAYGIDLLGYRYTGDPFELIKALLSRIDAPVCIAGSVNSYQRLDELKSVSPWAFTIGGAFFENKFEGSFKEQIDRVCDYMIEV